MRRRLALGLMVTLFVGGAVLWDRVLSTPTRIVFLVLDETLTAPRHVQLTWTVLRDGREIARGVVNARGGRLPLREALGAIPLKRGPHVLRVGFVEGGLADAGPLAERSVPFDVGDDEIVLVATGGDEP
jgi:hypothetical protein